MKPTLQSEYTRRRRGQCDLCRRPQCACNPFSSHFVSHPLIELRQYGKKGIGVRTLRKICRGDILEECVGHIVPITDNEDNVYSVAFNPPHVWFREGIAQISAKTLGNWTRFINHSCSATLGFQTMAIGERYRIMVVAECDIDTFSELTIDYGADYWLENVPGEVEKFGFCGQPVKGARIR